MNQGAIEIRKSAFQPGRRVQLVAFADDGGYQETLPVGSQGEVLRVDDMGTIHVRWDDGSTLGVLLEDQVLPLGP